MTIEVDELLSNSFVISIDRDRAAHFYRRFHDAGLHDPYPKLFRGYRMRVGDYRECRYHQGSMQLNCSRSHFDIVNIGRTLGLPFVCIFEDDALPCIGCRERLADALTDLPDDAHVVRLGWARFVKAPTMKIGDRGMYDDAVAWGSHAQIIFSGYYERYRDVFNNVNAIADVALLNSHYGNERERGHVLKIIRPLFMQKDAFAYRPMSGGQAGKALDHLSTKGDFDIPDRELSKEDLERYDAIAGGRHENID